MFCITAKYLCIISNRPPASWVVDLTWDFLLHHSLWKTHGRDRERETERDRDRERVRERQRQRESERETETERQRDRERGCRQKQYYNILH